MESIVQYDASKKEALSQFLKEVWAEAPLLSDKQHWEWKYIENPYTAGDVPAFFMYMFDNRIVGCLGLLAGRLKVNDQEIVASWHINLMVKDEHRRKGIATALVKKGCDHARVSLAMGGAETTFRLFKRLGWFCLGSLPLYSFVFKPGTKLRFAKGKPLRRIGSFLFWLARNACLAIKRKDTTRPVVFERVAAFDSRIDELWERVSPGYPVIVRRDKEFLNWRFAQRPDCEYTIFLAKEVDSVVGYLVLRIKEEKGQRVGLVADFLLPAGDTVLFSSLLGHALRWFKQNNAAYALCLTSDSRFGEVLKEHFFLKREYPGNQLAIDIGVHQDIVKERSSWHITLADSDQEFN